MKLNKISMFLAAMALVGCSNEDFNDPSVAQAIDDSSLVQLGENFVLAGVGEDGNTMRTHWELTGSGALTNKFLPIWGTTAPAGGNLIYDAATGKDAVLEAQAVGLCWLGNGAVGTDVYTNYEFYHFGWLKTGESAPIFECNELTNGARYDEIAVAAGDAAGAEADPANFSFATGVNKSFAITALNYNSGIYKTDNKAIFGGDYIVYYPYNENFKDAGTIPAKAETEFNNVSTKLDDQAVGHATFRYSSPVTIEGGAKASGFGLKNLSTLVQLRVAGPGTTSIGKSIDMIVLWSKKEQLLKQANLAADKIKAGKEGKDLYTETEGTKTIVASFAAPVVVEGTNSTSPIPTSAYITVLPTTVEDLVAFVHSTDGKWATVNLDNTVFEAGKAKRLDIPVTAGLFKSEYFAVDEATLNSALTEAAGSTATIQVIGDITLTADRTINEPNITIKGDKIIVPENVTLTLNTNLESDLQILGKACCTNSTWNGGRGVVNGGKLGNVTMEKAEATVTPANYDQYSPEVTFNGAAIVAADKEFDIKAGNVTVNAAVSHKANINIAEGVKLTVSSTGDLNFMGSTVVNDGTIEVKANGKFDMTNSDGGATAAAGKRMTNNGTFIHNVDAAVGTAVQSMNQNGEYRCRVDKQEKLDDAYQQWLACSVIEMVNTSAVAYNLGTAEPNINYKHNGKYIDIEVNATANTTFRNPDLGSGDGDSKIIQIGNLTINSTAAMGIYFVTGEGQRTLNVNGDMTVKSKTALHQSKKINITGNLNIEGAKLTYDGNKANVEGLAVAGDITVAGGDFNADDVDALNITCANFKLSGGAQAEFGNRTEGSTKNLTVSGEINNPSGCTFSIHGANQVAGSVLARITCKTLKVGGNFPGGRPQVVE